MGTQELRTAVVSGNQISRIKIKGFKSIRDAEIGLGMLNVLIGANGAGKSNFVSLFRMLNADVRGKLLNYVARQGGSERILYMGEKVTPATHVDFHTASGHVF